MNELPVEYRIKWLLRLFWIPVLAIAILAATHFDPITWRVPDPFSGGLGDHGLTMIGLITLAILSSIYYYEHKEKKGLKSAIISLIGGAVDAWLVVVLITLFYISMAYGLKGVLIVFFLPADFTSTTLLLAVGFYMIFGRLLIIGRKFGDLKYTLLLMASYAPLVAFWYYVLGGAWHFSAVAPGMAYYFPVALWEVSLGLYITSMYYIIVVRHLK